MTHKQQILKVLESRRSKGLTPFEAINLLGCTKLATRIGELIADGVKIKKEMVDVKTRNGNARVMRYWLAY